MGFMDLRQWMDLLEKEGELRRVTAEVDWNRELGTITRKAKEMPKGGPALLFNAIKGYRGGRCSKVFVSGLGNRERMALALGFRPDVSNQQIVQHIMKKDRGAVKPVRVPTGPVKDHIVTGDAVDLTEFPAPWGHYLDGGRYINTWAGIVTRDPDTGVLNVGIYRGMIGKKNTIPSFLVKGGQHWGQHFDKYASRGQPMPVACVLGWDPIFAFVAGSPIPTGVCEYDVMGAYRDDPVKLVRCETNDLEVPASAEVVIEGLVYDDPSTFEIEGPYGEFTGYVSDVPTLRPTIQVRCITHRDDPILRWCLEGSVPGSYSESCVMATVSRSAIAWNILNAAGIPGITDVFIHPITNGTNICVQIKKHYQGQPKQIAAALWGNSASRVRFKNVIVVDDDIDISSYEQLDWALAYRVNAGHGDLVVFPGSLGSPFDPSTPMEERDVARLGGGLWNRVLIDATRSWEFGRRAEWNGERFPPTVNPAPEDEALVKSRWAEYGLQ